jgi:hypothetical protein
VCIANLEVDPVFEMGPKVLEFEKVCQNQSHRVFKNLKNWAQTRTQRTYKNKILTSIESKVR